VGTPIGNLADITLRALDTLRDADLVLAEDTRRTRVLLAHHGIRAKILSLHAHNERARIPEVLREVEAGRNVAYVSDAGMPGISDPGQALVIAAAARGIAVDVVPGPSAVTAAIALAGIPAPRFVFEGFLPAKPGERRRRLEGLAAEPRALVFYEGPHRIVAALADMQAVFGDRDAAVARELTKVHEETRRGTLAELCRHFQEGKPRGEFTVVVAGAPGPSAIAGVSGARPSDEELAVEIEELMKEKGLSRRDALREIAARHGLDRQSLYRLFP
jgi:16S rRNA (cytidine1402-2'-O)-methyltransferase